MAPSNAQTQSMESDESETEQLMHQELEDGNPEDELLDLDPSLPLGLTLPLTDNA